MLKHRMWEWWKYIYVFLLRICGFDCVAGQLTMEFMAYWGFLLHCYIVLYQIYLTLILRIMIQTSIFSFRNFYCRIDCFTFLKCILQSITLCQVITFLFCFSFLWILFFSVWYYKHKKSEPCCNNKLNAGQFRVIRKMGYLHEIYTCYETFWTHWSEIMQKLAKVIK